MGLLPKNSLLEKKMSLLEKYSFGEIGRGMHASRNKGF
jgi:hypothetical protein